MTNPHRQRNRASPEHVESIRNINLKIKQNNRRNVLQSKLQKFAIDYNTNWKSHGADMDAIRAFKSKEVYSSGENHKTGSKFKYRTDGKSLFLHDYEIARHHKDGIEVSNAGYDSPLTYKTHQALGINSRGSEKHPKGLITLGTKEMDKNSGEWTLINHSDISEEPIIPESMKKNQKAKAEGIFKKRTQRKRTTSEQGQFRQDATKKELNEQGLDRGHPLSTVNIQKKDQRIINEITKLKTKIPTNKRGNEAHHLLEYSGDSGVGKKLEKNKDPRKAGNSKMIPKDYHKFITNFQKSSPKKNLIRLRQMDSKIRQLKVALIKENTANQNMQADKIIDSYLSSGLGYKGIDGVYDHENSTVLDGFNDVDSQRMQDLFNGQGKFIGTNSVTDTRAGSNHDIERVRKELREVEEAGGIPALGFDGSEEGSLEALNISVVNSKEEVMNALSNNQWGTGILNPDRKFSIEKSLTYKGRNNI